MMTIAARMALLEDGWASDPLIEIGGDGRIAAIFTDHGTNRAPGAVSAGILVPAPANCHSHAFQRAMAGLTEQRGPNADSFWTWRERMFRFLDRIDPDQVEAICAFVQMEMLEAGFAANVEFHYLHHQPGGAPYARLGEMCERVAAAAATSGIGLTLLPVHYQFGGCDRRPLAQGQIRFGNDPARFARLFEDARMSLTQLPQDCELGVAAHSLRAVAAGDIASTASLAAGGPVHMHLAEQLAEVDEVKAAYGARPVEWALANLSLGPNWCLIHCTQMLAHETRALAAREAVVGLCPLTEASLGDGIFDGVRWFDAGGRFAIGSDSNIRICLAEELRQLETGQRLRDHGRALLATAQQSTGRRLLEDAAIGGAQAAGRGGGRIAVGQWADLLALDADHVDLAGLSGDTALDAFIFAGGIDMVADVWSAGRHLVRDGRHARRDEITSAYRKAVASLRAGL